MDDVDILGEAYEAISSSHCHSRSMTPTTLDKASSVFLKYIDSVADAEILKDTVDDETA